LSKPTTGLRRAGIASFATGALALSACVVGAGAANADADFAFDRIAGDNRYETAAKAYDAFGVEDTVILANGQQGHYPDALVANYLAGVEGSPILLTKSDEMPEATQSRLDKGAKNITIVGGEGVVSAAQEAALKADGHTVTRLAGDNRYETAAAVIEAAGDAASTTALVSTGVDFPDALAAGPVSYDQGSPLAISRVDDIDDTEVAKLVDSGVSQFIVIGGPNAVGPKVIAELEAAGLDYVTRLAGDDRAATSVAVADYAIDEYGFTDEAINVASGYVAGTGADALAGGPLSGKNSTATLITRNVNNASDSVIAFLKGHANTLTEGNIFGGPGAVSEAAENAMEAAARSVTSNQDLTVAPQDEATMAQADELGATPDADNRTYTLSGLDANTTYSIGLVPADNVTNDGGPVSFKDDEGTATASDDNGQADELGAGAADADIAADIVNVNGAAVGPVVYTETKPVNGGISFTIDGDAAGSVIPVVWVDANGNDALDLNADNEPTENFGLGGETTFTAPAAGPGAPGGVVTAVDKAANTFSSGGALYTYDANDQYVIVGAGGVDMATFEAALSSEDTVGAVNYSPNSAGVSQFTLTDSNPATPTTTATQNAGTVVTDDDSDDITVTVTGASVGTGSYDSVVIERAVFNAATPDRNWVAVATVSKSDDADENTADADFNYVDRNVAPGTYEYRSALINDGDQSDFSAASGRVTSTTPNNDTTAPTAEDTRVATNGGSAFQLDGTDSFTVAFSEAVAAPTVGDAIRVRDTDGTIWEITAVDTDANTVPDNFTLNTTEVTIGGTTYAAGEVLTVTLGAAGGESELAPGTVAGLDLPATITAQSGTTDAAGNAWSIASGDVVIDNE
jgi:putative cell wall-binding protein